MWKWGSYRALAETRVVGGQPFGNMRIRIRYTSWIQSNVLFPVTLKPSVERSFMQRSVVSRSGFSS